MRIKTAQDRLVQTEKARALGGMAGGIAHEFNNILAIILGKTQLLLARSVDETVREGLGHVEEAAWRAADIVRRLQGFAATRLDDSNGPIEVNSLVHDAVTLTRGALEGRGGGPRHPDRGEPGPRGRRRPSGAMPRSCARRSPTWCSTRSTPCRVGAS